jgi:hypothetical protein
MLKSDLFVLSGLFDNASHLVSAIGSEWPVVRGDLLITLERLSDVDDEEEFTRLVDSMIEQITVTPGSPILANLLEGIELDPIRGSTTEIWLPPNQTWNVEIPGFGTVSQIVKRGVGVEHVKAAARVLQSELMKLDVAVEADTSRPAPHPPPTERRVNAWIAERPAGLTPPLVPGETYRLNFNVGVPPVGDLLPAAAVIPAADIPAEGLKTEWMVIADGADLGAADTAVTIDHDTAEGRTVALARFKLLVPRDQDSVTVSIAFTPNTPGPHLHILIFVRRQLYRSFEIALKADDDAHGRHDRFLPLSAERMLGLASEMSLAPPFEWTTPPGELTVWLGGGMANAYGDVSTALGSRDEVRTFVLQSAASDLAGHIKNVRASAERFRGQHDAYLNAIDRGDLDARLGRWQPAYDWSHLPLEADVAHQQAWEVVARSPELRDLALDGYTLFRKMFQRTDLLDWLASLLPGHRLNIVSLPVPGTIPNVPFGLMYVLDPPKAGEPVDPMGFAGLRFRLEYRAHDVPDTAKALVGASGGHRVNVLYWGSNAADQTLQEADAQRAAWGALPNQRFVPAQNSADPRAEVLATLADPKPSPVAILYFFCQCSVGSGNDPVLEFTDSFDVADAIRRNDLGVTSLADRPLIFANACTTASGDPYVANLLESEFFARDCRGFLGTETKVPIGLASRFAEIFFRFFERRITSEPLSAGESVAQTRLCLWTSYRNIGGLFYTYVNQYELFMASKAEVEAARRP